MLDKVFLQLCVILKEWNCKILLYVQVSQVLAALQAGSRGTQACINAASTVSGIIGDLDTTIMFATAGTLHAENEEESFANHRENILKTAKALVEDTKTLVAGMESSLSLARTLCFYHHFFCGTNIRIFLMTFIPPQ